MRIEENTLIFDTRRDFEAMMAVVRRSQLGYTTPEVKSIEIVVGETECDHIHPKGYRHDEWKAESIDCPNNAVFRVIRYRGKGKIYSNNYCRQCFVSECNFWLNDQLRQMTRTAEKNLREKIGAENAIERVN